MADMQFAKGTEDDYRELCKYIPKIFKAENYAQIVSDPAVKFVSFKKGEELVGGSVYTLTTHRPNPEDFPSSRVVLLPAVEMDMFGIMPAYRCKGLGTLALSMEEWMLKKEHEAVLLTLKALDFDLVKWFANRGYQLAGDDIERTRMVKLFEDNYEKGLRKEGLIS